MRPYVLAKGEGRTYEWHPQSRSGGNSPAADAVATLDLPPVSPSPAHGRAARG